MFWVKCWFDLLSGYTTYGRKWMSWLPSAKIIGRRFSLAAACIPSSIDKLLLYSVKFELKLTMCRWCCSKLAIAFGWWNPFALLNNRLASSILSADLFATIWSLIGPLIDWIETRFCVELPVLGTEIGGCVEPDDDDDVVTEDDPPDDDDDDDDDDDFFSFASCWAFFERFHFIRRFWNHILTYIWRKNVTEKKKKRKTVRYKTKKEKKSNFQRINTRMTNNNYWATVLRRQGANEPAMDREIKTKEGWDNLLKCGRCLGIYLCWDLCGKSGAHRYTTYGFHFFECDYFIFDGCRQKKIETSFAPSRTSISASLQQTIWQAVTEWKMNDEICKKMSAMITISRFSCCNSVCYECVII